VPGRASATRTRQYDRGMASTIGAVTMGQSPRDDIVPELAAVLGAGCEIVQVGVLDDLSVEEIESRRGKLGRGGIVTRLRDGEEVRVGQRLVERRFRQCVEDLDGRVAMILVLCTGDLPLLRTRAPILYPGRILRSLTRSLGVARLGVLTPDAAQIRAQRRRWRGLARRIFVLPASPYDRSEALTKAAERFRRNQVQLIVMDCIGYTREMQRAVRDAAGVPVLSALSLLGLAAAELLGSADSEPAAH
jgi:protein AroM